MFDDEVLDIFLENQLQLLPEPVAESREEAKEFLEDCMAVVCDSIQDVRDYFEEIADVTDLDDEELAKASEVFAIGDGRYLVVEA